MASTPEAGPFVFRRAIEPATEPATEPEAALPALALTATPDAEVPDAPDVRLRRPFLPLLPEADGGALPDAGLSYFRQKLTQYWLFPTGDDHPAACMHVNLSAMAIIYGLITKSESQRPTWGDLHQLELALLEVTPEATLRGQAWLLRARYRDAVSPMRFRLYEQSRLCDDQSAMVEDLRADQEVLLSELHRLHLALPVPAETHTEPLQASGLAGFCHGVARGMAALLAPLHL